MGDSWQLGQGEHDSVGRQGSGCGEHATSKGAIVASNDGNGARQHAGRPHGGHLVQLPSIGDPVGIEGELPAESGHERFERLWIEWGLLPDPSESGQQQCGWQARVERFHIFYHPSHPSSRQSKHLKSVEES